MKKKTVAAPKDKVKRTQGLPCQPVYIMMAVNLRNIEFSEMNAKKTVIVLLAVAAALWGGWRLAGAGPAPEDMAGQGRSQAIPVTAAAAVLRDVPLSLSAVGAVVTYQSVALRARIDSQVMEVKFRDGDAVAEGDLLFVLDDRALTAQIRQLEANLARDRAQMQNLKRQHARKKSLFEKGYETGANLDEAKAQLDVQAATVHAAQAGLENLKVQMQYTQVLAPIGGRTGTINVTAGNTVKANDTTPLVTINQVKPVRAQVSIPQKYLAALRAALAAGPVPVTARHEGGNGASEGVLDYIDNAIDPSTGTFTARASFANDDEKLWPGMFVTAHIVLGDERGVVTVPEVSIQHGQDGDFVFVVSDGRAVQRPVTVARLHDGLAVIAQGLAAGESVAVDGMMKLSDGAAVSMAAPPS